MADTKYVVDIYQNVFIILLPVWLGGRSHPYVGVGDRRFETDVIEALGKMFAEGGVG